MISADPSENIGDKMGIKWVRNIYFILGVKRLMHPFYSAKREILLRGGT